MQQLLFALKQQLNILTILMVLLLTGLLAKRFDKRLIMRISFSLAGLLFLLSSTNYLPRYLATRLEEKYLPYYPDSSGNPAPVYIHVLGSGYNIDERLPPNARIGPVAMIRLAEALRLHKQLPNSTLICSGNSMFGVAQTQAQATQKAAILLGVDSSHTATLNAPSTTAEEALELKKLYGSNIRLILVTDAMHMPRAMLLFQQQGFHPIAAPTNYRVPLGGDEGKLRWWPAMVNMQLADIVLHEYLGRLKAGL